MKLAGTETFRETLDNMDRVSDVVEDLKNVI